VRDEEPSLIELLLGALSAIDAAILCVVLLGIAVAFLDLGHTAGTLVAGGLIVLWQRRW
jgi:hypothetical protein